MWDREAPERLKEKFPEAVLAVEESRGEVALRVKKEEISSLCQFLREELSYDMLIDLCGVDYPSREKRFEVVYLLHSMKGQRRLRLKASLAEGEAIASVEGIWKAAGWLEREVYDMFGVKFEGHSDLRRILTW